MGYHLSRRLLREGIEVLGVDDLNPYYDVGLKQGRLARLTPESGFRFREMDIAQPDAFLAVLRDWKPEVVVNLAARAGVRNPSGDLWAYARPNLDGFVSVFDACRQAPPEHIVYASSSSVYGVGSPVPFREDDGADRPASFYAATKRSNEMMAHAFAGLTGIPCTALRFFTLYGPWGRPDMAYYSFTEAIAAGRIIALHDAAVMRRDFTYVDDAVEAVTRLMRLRPGREETGSPHRVYNVGNSQPVALLDFVATLEDLLGRKAEVRHLPIQPGEVPLTYADTSRLQADTGYAPHTSIRDGLTRFVAWFREYQG